MTPEIASHFSTEQRHQLQRDMVTPFCCHEYYETGFNYDELHDSVHSRNEVHGVVRMRGIERP